MAANSWEGLIASWESRLQAAFLDAVYQIRNQAQVDLIVARLEAGDIDGAIRAVGLNPAQFRLFDKTFEAAYEAGGIATVKAIPPVADAEGYRVQFQFNIRNPVAEQWLRQYSATLVRQIVDDQRNMIRDFLRAGMEAGNNPRTTALDLVGRVVSGNREGGVIGLTTSQEQWLRNYAAELASDSPQASLARALRDRRFDKTVLRAAREGVPIPAETQAKMLAAYKNRALRYRAETIARTESMTALHQAQDQALQQAVASGAVRADQIITIWRDSGDDRVREAHRDLDGQSVPFGGTFQSILGPIRYPGDPSASAENRIGCRCWLEPKVDFLAGIE